MFLVGDSCPIIVEKKTHTKIKLLNTIITSFYTVIRPQKAHIYQMDSLSETNKGQNIGT